MMRKLIFTLTVFTLLLAACAPSGQPPQSSEQPPVITEEPSSGAVTEYPGPDVNVIVPTVPSSYPSPDAPVSSGGGGGSPIDSIYAPQPGDDKLVRGNVFLEWESSELLIMESFPIQVTALLRGNLPDPCHQLRAVVTVDEEKKRVDIEVYSLAQSGVACITVLEPFEASVPLGSFSGGSYSVYANGEMLGTFEASASSPTADGKPFTVASLQMLDTMTGWATGGADGNSDRVYFTRDGGLTWQDLTPPQPAPANGALAALVFFCPAHPRDGSLTTARI